jgi:hypothetical protein
LAGHALRAGDHDDLRKGVRIRRIDETGVAVAVAAATDHEQGEEPRDECCEVCLLHVEDYPETRTAPSTNLRPASCPGHQ